MIKNKVFRIPLILGIITALISFLFGIGDMYTGFEGTGFSLSNIVLTIFGAGIAGLPVFIIALIISYIYHKSKKKVLE